MCARKMSRVMDELTMLQRLNEATPCISAASQPGLSGTLLLARAWWIVFALSRRGSSGRSAGRHRHIMGSLHHSPGLRGFQRNMFVGSYPERHHLTKLGPIFPRPWRFGPPISSTSTSKKKGWHADTAVLVCSHI